MKFNCESRIRGYIKEVTQKLTDTCSLPGLLKIPPESLTSHRHCSQVDEATRTVQKAKVKAELLKTSKCLAEMLKADKYNGCYFDRTEREPDRLCTQEGWFTCQVLWDMVKKSATAVKWDQTYKCF